MRIPTSAFMAAMLASVVACSAAAYEKETHRQLSVTAYDLSGIASTLQQVYGIGPRDAFEARALSGAGGPHTAQDWVRIGGSAEDAPGWRTFNHFYDPISKLGLHALGGAPAPDWALEDV